MKEGSHGYWQLTGESTGALMLPAADTLEPLLQCVDDGIDFVPEQSPSNAIHIIHVERSMDPDVGIELGQEIQELIANGTCKVIVRLKKFSHLHSTGIQALLHAQKVAKQRGGKVVLVCSDVLSLKRFSMIGFSKQIEITPTESQALSLLDTTKKESI